MLWLKDLRVGQWIESCIGLIQENSIKSSLQSNLSYIPIHIVHASYCTSYSKVPCVRHKVNMWCICCMTSLLLEPSTSFHASYDLLLSLLLHHLMWLICDWVMLSLTLTLSSKNRKIKIDWNENENKNKKIRKS